MSEKPGEPEQTDGPFPEEEPLQSSQSQADEARFKRIFDKMWDEYIVNPEPLPPEVEALLQAMTDPEADGEL